MSHAEASSAANGHAYRDSPLLVVAFSIMLMMVELVGYVLQFSTVYQRIMLVCAASVVSLAAVWLYRKYLEHRSVLHRIILFLLPIAIGTTLTFATYFYFYQTVPARYVAPSLRRLGKPLPTTSTYGTNATVGGDVLLDAESGPHRYFLRFTFEPEDTDPVQGSADWRFVSDLNGGWILFLGRYDASAYRRLVFGVRGQEASEPFAVGLKDRGSTEVKILIQPGTSEEDPSAWRTVGIPLEAFESRAVDLSALDNLSISVDTAYSDAERTELDICSIRFER